MTVFHNYDYLSWQALNKNLRSFSTVIFDMEMGDPLNRENCDIKCVRSVDVYDQLRREILFRELSPGSYIDAREKSEAYGTSTVPVREALLRLSENGLLIRERNRGFAVRRFIPDEIAFAHDAIRHLSVFQREQSGRNRSNDSSRKVALIEHGELADPYWFFNEVIKSASKIFSPYLLNQFFLNLNVVSTTWNIIDGKIVLPDTGLIYLSRFAGLAALNDFDGALRQLQQFDRLGL
ncbi:hypothetical protein CQ054_22575 [Ochrobactrum sp. MYb29]|nr:hypothetical protein CQ054_22575 [Ochrobactrum sp. MYb29]